MTSDDTDALVATLQLLLADKKDEDIRSLIYKAFPSSFIILKGDARKLGDYLHHAAKGLKEIAAQADGATPLGILAVKQVNIAANTAFHEVSMAAQIVGVKLK